MENLNESIKKILLNIQYDNSFTLSENYSNVKRLNEARFNVGAAREVDVIKGLGKSLDELLVQLKIKNLGTGEMKTLLAKDSQNFVKELEKAALKDLEAGVAVGKIGDNLKEVGKIDFMRRVSEKVGNMKSPRKLSNAEMAALENESRLAQMEIMATVKPKGPKPAKPPVPPVVPPPPPKPRTIDVLKKWGGYAGIAVLGSAAVYALFNWLNGKGNDSELLDVAKKCGYNSVEEFQAANFKCPKGGDIVPPKPKQYRNCENETVQTYGCKSSLIRQVQDCLGVVIDGIWGPKTNTAISANASKFLGGFTNDDIKEICSSSSNKITNTTDREKIIDPEDVGAGLSSSSTTTSNSTTSTDGGRTSPSDKASFYNPNLMD